MDFTFICFVRMCFSVHICVTYCHTLPGVAERFIRDVAEVVESLLQNPDQKSSEGV